MAQQLHESPAWRVSGFLGAAGEVLLLLFAGNVLRQVVAGGVESSSLWMAVGALIMAGLGAGGFFAVNPNETRVVVFLGRYVGSVRDSGFWWTNPLTLRTRVSLRVRNFNSDKLKVNDAHGNPVEIAAVVVWRVVDSAKALFDVDNYEAFVAIQSETAIRALASRYPYDAVDEETSSLRAQPDKIADALRHEVEARLQVAGVQVLETRISHLAYAPEIAQAMLRRQQAEAIIAARQKIVEGAVGMVEMALRTLSEHRIVDLSEERKAVMVNNLLVALVSESQAQPVINTSSLAP